MDELEWEWLWRFIEGDSIKTGESIQRGESVIDNTKDDDKSSEEFMIRSRRYESYSQTIGIGDGDYLFVLL
jgi:hypothetical protein